MSYNVQKHCNVQLKFPFISSIWIATEFLLLFSAALCCYTSHSSPFTAVTNMRTCTGTHTNTNSTTHFTWVSLFVWGEVRRGEQRNVEHVAPLESWLVDEWQSWRLPIHCNIINSITTYKYRDPRKVHTCTQSPMGGIFLHLFGDKIIWNMRERYIYTKWVLK